MLPSTAPRWVRSRCSFNRRGDSLGGAAQNGGDIHLRIVVSIAGAILWGVLPIPAEQVDNYRSFQSQGRFFGGCCAALGQLSGQRRLVSIAGAILWGVLLHPSGADVARFTRFNRRGDSLGGAALLAVIQVRQYHSFNRRGDSLGGAAPHTRRKGNRATQFQSQGRFFGGCCPPHSKSGPRTTQVSIAGAILWGVLRVVAGGEAVAIAGFNRRGDSLGGAARQEERDGDGLSIVSIAGAILWGVLPARRLRIHLSQQFQSQGRFFGGCCLIAMFKLAMRHLFQSQGRFFGGCCKGVSDANLRSPRFNRRGDSLGGAASRRFPPAPLRSPQFQSQGRFFGGCCSAALSAPSTR